MSSLGMAIALFMAGMAEYAIFGGWYAAFHKGRIVSVIALTHVQLLLWLFVVGSVVSVIQDPEAPWWLIAVYVEGCALSAGLTAWFARSRPAASNEEGRRVRSLEGIEVRFGASPGGDLASRPARVTRKRALEAPLSPPRSHRVEGLPAELLRRPLA